MSDTEELESPKEEEEDDEKEDIQKSEEGAPAAKKKKVSGISKSFSDHAQVAAYASAVSTASCRALILDSYVGKTSTNNPYWTLRVVVLGLRASEAATTEEGAAPESATNKVSIPHKVKKDEKDEEARFDKARKAGVQVPEGGYNIRTPFDLFRGDTLKITVFSMSPTGVDLPIGAVVLLHNLSWSVSFVTEKMVGGGKGGDDASTAFSSPFSGTRNLNDPIMSFSGDCKILYKMRYMDCVKTLATIQKNAIQRPVLEYPPQAMVKKWGGLDVTSASADPAAGEVRGTYWMHMLSPDVLYSKSNPPKLKFLEIYNPIWMDEDDEGNWEVSDRFTRPDRLPVFIVIAPGAKTDGGEEESCYTIKSQKTGEVQAYVGNAQKCLIGLDVTSAPENKFSLRLQRIWNTGHVFGVTNPQKWEQIGCQVTRAWVALLCLDTAKENASVAKTDPSGIPIISGDALYKTNFWETFRNAGLKVSKDYAMAYVNQLIMDGKLLPGKYMKDNAYSQAASRGEAVSMVNLLEFEGAYLLTVKEPEWEFYMVPPYKWSTEENDGKEGEGAGAAKPHRRVLLDQKFAATNMEEDAKRKNEEFIQKTWKVKNALWNHMGVFAVSTSLV